MPYFNNPLIADFSVYETNITNIHCLIDKIRKESSFSLCLSSESSKDIKDFLEKQKKIKVVIGQGGGYGHQKAAVTGMQRLIELGFKGEFLLQTEHNNPDFTIKQRLAFLLESYPKIKINWLSNGFENDERFKIGFCFGSDTVSMSLSAYRIQC